MGVVMGIVIVGILFGAMYAGYGRVLTSKRYATRQRKAPDLNRFAEESQTDKVTPRTSGPARPEIDLGRGSKSQAL